MALVTSEVSYGSPGTLVSSSQHRLPAAAQCLVAAVVVMPLPGRRLSTSRRCRTGCQPTSLPADRFRTRLIVVADEVGNGVSTVSETGTSDQWGDRVVALDAQGTFARAVGQSGRVKGHGNGVRAGGVVPMSGATEAQPMSSGASHACPPPPMVVSPVTFMTMCIPGKPRSPVGSGSGTPQAAAAR